MFCDESAVGLGKCEFDIRQIVTVGTNITWTPAPDPAGVTPLAVRQFSRAAGEPVRREALQDRARQDHARLGLSAANEPRPIAVHRRFLLETRSV